MLRLGERERNPSQVRSLVGTGLHDKNRVFRTIHFRPRFSLGGNP